MRSAAYLGQGVKGDSRRSGHGVFDGTLDSIGPNVLLGGASSVGERGSQVETSIFPSLSVSILGRALRTIPCLGAAGASPAM